MKLQEYHAKALLQAAGLPVPPWQVATTAAQARAQAADALAAGAGRVVVKAQVLVGGRGKAGGVKLAGTADEAEAAAAAILGMDIKGITVRRVLVAAAADIEHEFYLAATLDRAAQRVLVMGSAEGGVEIEEVAATRPEAILRVHAHPHLGLLDFQARRIAFGLGLGGPHLRAATAVAQGLVACLMANDADLVEVNPLGLVRTTGPDGQPVTVLQCLDAKVTLDDSALPRHPGLEALRDLDEEDPTDAQARAMGINFIKLEGNIGCIVNGAGLAMTTMDLVKLYGGAPANFLDIGGGARADQVAAAMRLILDDPGVRAILVNIFGGITRGDEVARGLVEARAQQQREVPMVVRIVGTNAAEAAAILEAAAFQTAASLDEAAQKAVAAAAQGANAAR
ncbi:MAG TPA: ADP-forming succinate--CoA ligase subunit beta [Candidatus Sulfotelmatobacter sp.]|nr:ADP-forming succinate--CoA ligase subunit beta [Candidatus Sulfotelmatobacter sp.]